jgi:hypothetical protein
MVKISVNKLEYIRQWRLKNLNKVRATARRWALKNYDPEYQRRWREKNRAKTSEYSYHWRLKNPDKVLAMRRRYYLNNQDRIRESARKQREKTPDKHTTRKLVHNAVRRGELKRQKCWCGAEGQAHHEDYTKPYQIMWLCRKHHAELHRKYQYV